MDKLTVEKDDDGWHIIRTASDGTVARSEVYRTKADAVAVTKSATDGTYEA